MSIWPPILYLTFWLIGAICTFFFSPPSRSWPQFSIGLLVLALLYWGNFFAPLFG